MSNFRSTLEALMRENAINQVQLSRASGISESMLTRIRSGDKKRIDPEDLIGLSSAAANPAQQAQLLRAHLLDEAVGPARNLIRVEIAAPEQLQEDFVKTDADSAIDILRRHCHEDDIREIVIHLANLIKYGDVGTALSQDKPSPVVPLPRVTYTQRRKKK